jgi:hypothetical protein
MEQSDEKKLGLLDVGSAEKYPMLHADLVRNRIRCSTVIDRPVKQMTYELIHEPCNHCWNFRHRGLLEKLRDCTDETICPICGPIPERRVKIETMIYSSVSEGHSLVYIDDKCPIDSWRIVVVCKDGRKNRETTPKILRENIRGGFSCCYLCTADKGFQETKDNRLEVLRALKLTPIEEIVGKAWNDPINVKCDDCGRKMEYTISVLRACWRNDTTVCMCGQIEIETKVRAQLDRFELELLRFIIPERDGKIRQVVYACPVCGRGHMIGHRELMEAATMICLRSDVDEKEEKEELNCKKNDIPESMIIICSKPEENKHEVLNYKKTKRYQAVKEKFLVYRFELITKLDDWKNSYTKCDVKCLKKEDHLLCMSNVDLINKLNNGQELCKYCYAEDEAREVNRAIRKLKDLGHEFVGLDKSGTRGIFYRCNCADTVKHTCFSNVLDDIWEGCPECRSWGFKSVKRKEYKFPSGRVEYVLGYENLCIDDLLKEGYGEDEIVVLTSRIPIIKYLKKYKDGTEREGRYYPDIKLPGRLVEVKSIWTYQVEQENNERKFAETAKQGHILELRIYNDKKKLVEKRVYKQLGNIVVCFMDPVD